VIVAEDDPDMRQLLAEILRRDGCAVTEVNEGGQLLAMLEMDRQDFPADVVDLLITDVRMPTGNGLVIVGALRDAGWKQPVIAMTAFSDASVKNEAKRVGATLLDKPFRMDVLRELVRGFFESTRSRDGASGPIRPSGTFRRIPPS
jgi:DNA-binding response OmpR family regulator